MDIPAPVVAAQAAADKAWADVEAYRKTVDAQRATDPKVELKPGVMVTRPWTDEENATFADLQRAAVEAATIRRQAMTDAGIASTWDTERATRAAARGDAE